MELKSMVTEWLQGKVDAIGFASVDRYDSAPEAHHPSRVCKDAASVIVFGKVVPRGMLHSPDYNLHIMHRAYHSIYPYLDDLALSLSTWLEAQGKYLAVPIPSYAPMTFHGAEPWGLMSLKHAAVNAGLGTFGKNGLMHHRAHGTLLRLGAVVTNAEIPGDPVLQDSPCPEKCEACLKMCPPNALDTEKPFRKMKCLPHTIKHAIYPLALKDEESFRHIERVVNTAGYNYWLACHECLRVCPNNKRTAKTA